MQPGQRQRRSDEGRSRIAPSSELRYSTRLVNRSLPVDTPESTLPSSHSGSATSRWPPPTSTCTPTWRRKSEPSPESPRPARRLAATSRPTRYSPSSTASDCSDLPPVDSPATHTNPRAGRNNHDVGSIGVVPTSEQRRLLIAGRAAKFTII